MLHDASVGRLGVLQPFQNATSDISTLPGVTLPTLASAMAPMLSRFRSNSEPSLASVAGGRTKRDASTDHSNYRRFSIAVEPCGGAGNVRSRLVINGITARCFGRVPAARAPHGGDMPDLFPACFFRCRPAPFYRCRDTEIFKFFACLQRCCKPSRSQPAPRPRFRWIIRIAIFRGDYAARAASNSFAA